MTTKRVWLIRHGQTDYNAEHRWQGHMATDLNPAGHREAEALAAHLASIQFDAIYSSDLNRARQTADHVAAPHKLSPIPDERLREIKLGIFQGHTTEEITQKYPEEHERWRSSDETYTPPEGESRWAVGERAVAALRDAAATDATHLALVAHGGTIRLLLRALFPDDPTYQGKLEVPNTSYTLLEQNPSGTWTVLQMPSTPHLDGQDTAINDHP